MKFLFQNNRVRFLIGRITMVFKIFLNHFICDVACTPNSVADTPKMVAPITFPKIRKFFLKASGRPSFHSFDKIAYGLGRSVFNMDVNMVFAYDPFKYMHIFRITDLLDQIPTSYLNVTLENMISIFCNPNYMCSKTRNGVTHTSLFFHKPKIRNWVATESLALKVHSFN